MVVLNVPLGKFTSLDDATHEFLAAVGRRCEDEKEPMAMGQRKTLEKKGLLSCLGASMEDEVVAMFAKGNGVAVAVVVVAKESEE
jgi:hypothetical protein